MEGSTGASALLGPQQFGWAQVQNIRRDPFEQSVGEEQKSVLSIRRCARLPSTAYLYNWNMLPVGQQLWLQELSSYIEFPPLQDPETYNLVQVLDQVKKMGDRVPAVTQDAEWSVRAAHGSPRPERLKSRRRPRSKPRAPKCEARSPARSARVMSEDRRCRTHCAVFRRTSRRLFSDSLVGRLTLSARHVGQRRRPCSTMVASQRSMSFKDPPNARLVFSSDDRGQDAAVVLKRPSRGHRLHLRAWLASKAADHSDGPAGLHRQLRLRRGSWWSRRSKHYHAGCIGDIGRIGYGTWASVPEPTLRLTMRLVSRG